MKKTILMASLIAFSALTLTGCGESKPEDIAIEFVESFTAGDIKEAKSLSSNDLKRDFKRVQRSCNEIKFKELKSSGETLANKMKKVMKDPKIAKSIKKEGLVFKEIMRERDNHDSLMSKKWIKEYGSVKEIPQKLVDEHVKNYNEITLKASNDFLKSQLDMAGIDYDKVSYDIVLQLLIDQANEIRSYNPIRTAINGYLDKHPSKITPDCVNDASKFGYIEEINFIEVNKEAADRVEVRLELIDKDGKSNKTTIDVEKIKGEWKVSNI